MIYLFWQGALLTVLLDLVYGRITYLVTVPLILVGILTAGWPIEPITVILAGATYAVLMTLYVATRLRGRVAIWDGDAALCAALAPVVGLPGIAWVMMGALLTAWGFVRVVTVIRRRPGPESLRMAPFFVTAAMIYKLIV